MKCVCGPFNKIKAILRRGKENGDDTILAYSADIEKKNPSVSNYLYIKYNTEIESRLER